MPSNEPLVLRFPKDGLAENAAYSDQPPTVSQRLLNVLPFDPVEDRARGGQRSGCGTYYDSPISADDPIQHLAQITRIVNAQSIIQGEELYSRSFNDQPQPYPIASDSQEWFHEPAIGGDHPRLFNAAAVSGNFRYLRTGDEVVIDLSNKYNEDGSVASTTDIPDTDNAGRSMLWNAAGDDYDRDAQFIVKTRVETIIGDSGGEYFFGIGIRVKSSANECFNCGWHKISGGNTFEIGMWKEQNSGSTQIGTPSVAAAADTSSHDLEVRVNKYYVEIYWDGVLKYQQTLTGADGFDSTSHRKIGWCYYRKRGSGTWSSNTAAPTLDQLKVYDALQPTTGRDTKLVVVTEGDLYAGTKADGFAVPSGGTDAFDALALACESEVVFQKLYVVDTGTNMRVYNPATNAVTAVAASAGSLPGSAGHRPTIIRLWNGRLVYSGVDSEPHNWFMSRQFQNVGDENDFDYTDTDIGAAVAGNNAQLGQIGDIITCLISYPRGPLVFGCQKEIWVLKGNPGPGGVASLDRLMDKVGIVGKRAFCIDPSGTTYFMGSDGFYKMSTDGLSIDRVRLLSANRLDKTLRSINIAANDIKLIWSHDWRGVIVFVTPIDSESETTHYFWSARTNGFYPIQIPVASGPTAVLNYNDDDPANRALILGGRDGYLREFHPSLKHDHGTKKPYAINSYVEFAPFGFADNPRGRSMLVAVEGTMDNATDSVDIAILAAEDEKSLVNASPHVLRRWGSGDTARINRRIAGARLGIRLSNSRLDESWAMENVIVEGFDIGPARRAVKS